MANDYETERRVWASMRHAGWVEDKPSGGWRKGAAWVSYGQAEAAFVAADSGQAYRPDPVSETVARVVAAAVNDEVE